MDRYKFRAKAIEEMADGNQWIVDGFGVQFIELADGGFECVLYTPHGYYHVDPETVGQFTGLKDKNGKEIYEGDILRDQESYDEIYYYKVIWHEANACFYFKDCFGDYECFQGEDLYLNQIEVIGNIYEHPHLLKGDENE